jgi:phosphatidylinositol 4-kinase
MGRAKINDLTEFFLFQFGPAEGVSFQRARNNFIQSMAAYSVLCYILQIKDRHNGNIMIDGEGRITHIDFGFLFDIGPGGIKFEPNSFKLTHEMITLMGGKGSQGYRQFRELTVKAFLACRPYVEDVVSTCSLMMPTQLPSFKGEGTIVRLKDRFKPDLTEREAARYMMGVIDNACENSMSIVYDQFQVSDRFSKTYEEKWAHVTFSNSISKIAFHTHLNHDEVKLHRFPCIVKRYMPYISR